LKSLIFHLGGFRFLAHLLIASALVFQKLAQVLNSGLPCKGSLTRFQEKLQKEKSMVAVSFWEATNQAKEKYAFHFHQKSSVVVARAPPVF